MPIFPTITAISTATKASALTVLSSMFTPFGDIIYSFTFAPFLKGHTLMTRYEFIIRFFEIVTPSIVAIATSLFASCATITAPKKVQQRDRIFNLYCDFYDSYKQFISTFDETDFISMHACTMKICLVCSEETQRLCFEFLNYISHIKRPDPNIVSDIELATFEVQRQHWELMLGKIHEAIRKEFGAKNTPLFKKAINRLKVRLQSLKK